MHQGVNRLLIIPFHLYQCVQVKLWLHSLGFFLVTMQHLAIHWMRLILCLAFLLPPLLLRFPALAQSQDDAPSIDPIQWDWMMRNRRVSRPDHVAYPSKPLELLFFSSRQ